MKLIQIQYFLKVAECKSMTKAAEQLFISQPTLSKQMNQLEEELGVKLLKRTAAGISLTETGEDFAKDCRLVITDLEKAITKAINAGNKEAGVLRIGCFDGAVVEDFLPELYAYFRKKAPGMLIKLGRRSIGENRKALDSDSIDMLIELRFPSMPEDPYLKNCREQSLVVREGAFIYSENSPLAKKKKLTLKDFAEETYYMISSKEEAMLSEAGLHTLRTLGIENPRIEKVDNFVTLMSNIRLGLGYSALSKLAVQTHPGLLAFDLPENQGMEVIAVWKKNNQFVTGLMKQFKG